MLTTAPNPNGGLAYLKTTSASFDVDIFISQKGIIKKAMIWDPWARPFSILAPVFGNQSARFKQIDFNSSTGIMERGEIWEEQTFLTSTNEKKKFAAGSILEFNPEGKVIE